LSFWAVGYFWKGGFWLSIENLDVDTGRRPVDWDVIHAERARIAALPAWGRLLKFLF